MRFFGPCALVQIVNILRYQQHIASPFCFEPGQRFVRGVGLDFRIQQARPALIIEGMNPVWITGKRFWRCHILDTRLRPDSVGVAERGETGFL